MSIVFKENRDHAACATALGALTAAPSLAGVITPTDKTAVSTGSPVESVYHRYGWCHHHHYTTGAPAHGFGVPLLLPLCGWGGWGWGGGGLFGGGLFGIL